MRRRRHRSSRSFSTGPEAFGIHTPLMPANAGIQSFGQRTGSPLSWGRAEESTASLELESALRCPHGGEKLGHLLAQRLRLLRERDGGIEHAARLGSGVACRFRDALNIGRHLVGAAGGLLDALRNP